MKWLVLVAMVLLAGCAPGPNPVLHTPMCSDPAGFWLGLWHGLIAPITFFVSLFTDDVSIYAVCNTGGWYDFGFYLGVGSSIGGGSSASRRRRRRSNS